MAELGRGEREERDERDDRDAAERFDRYLEALLGEGRPAPDAVGDRDEAEMARTAAELAALARPEAAEPDPAFVEQLRLRMREADAGIASVRTPPPVREPRPTPTPTHTVWHVSRRDVLRAGIGAAAGLAAGAVGLSLTGDRQPAQNGLWRDTPLVAGQGFWAEVATLAELPPGAAARFSTAAFDGYVVNDGGEVRALSSVCTHMQCTLHYRPDWQDLRCPCHGASFDLRGRLANGPATWGDRGGYPGDARAYPVDLPDLARPRVKVEDGSIYVWTAQV